MAINKVLCIEVGFATTRIVEIDYMKKNPKVYNCVIFDTPENMIEDGFIRDKAQMGALISDGLARAGINTRDVIFTIYSNKIVSREVLIPQVKDNMIANIVKGDANEYFPVDVSEHSITYTLLDKAVETEDKSKKIKLIVYAAPEILVSNYYELASEFGGNVVSIDYTGNSVYQVLKRTSLDETSFVLQINAASSLITIMENKILTLQRTINYGMNTLADVVVDNPYYESNSRKKAIELLCNGKETLLKPTFDTDIMPNMQNGVVPDSMIRSAEGREEITEAARPFINNIRRVIEYYVSKTKIEAINKIYLTGTGINIKGLPELISNEIGIPVEIVKSTETVAFKGMVSKYEQNGYELIPVIGASYEPAGFVPSNVKVLEQRRDTFNLFIIVGAAAIVVGIFIVLVMYLQMWNARKKMEQLQEEVESKRDIERIYNEYVMANNAYQEVALMHALTYTYNEQLNEVISELEKKLTKDTTIHSLDSQDDKLNLNVSVPGKESAAQLIMQLKSMEQYFSLVEVSALAEEEEEVTGRKNVTFSITCTYKPQTDENNSQEAQ